MKKKAIITISGGIDSTTTAAIAKSRGYGLYFLTVNYGQKNIDRELENTKYFAEYFGAEKHKIIDMTWLGELGKSGMTDSSIEFDKVPSLFTVIEKRFLQCLFPADNPGV